MDETTVAGTEPAPPGAPSRVMGEVRGGPAMRLEARFAPTSLDAGTRTVEVTWTTGAAVTRRDYWTGESWIEELEVSERAIDLSRLNAGAPVLNSHRGWDLGDVIGVVERAWIEHGEGRARLRFSEREEVAPIFADIRAGIIRNVSVGYSVSEWKETRREDGTRVRRAVRWQPAEISLVPVPADAKAQVRAAEGASLSTRAGTAAARNPEVRMDETANPGATVAPTTTPALAPAAPDAAALEAARAEAREAELARIRGIEAACRALGLEGEAAELIREGVSLADAQARLIQRAAEQRQAAGPGPAPAAVTVLRDEGDTARRALGEALLHRAGLLRNADGTPAPLPEAARQYRGFRLRDFAAECIALRGGTVRGLTAAEIARAALGSRDHMSRAGIGMHATSDFPNLLANTASKALGQGYGSARRTFTAWARRRTLPDFKDFRVVNLSGAPKLAQIAEGGEITFGAFGEGAETYRAYRYGRRVAITFEAIVNDDMDGFTRLPQMFGASAARLESELVYGIFNTNPNMADGKSLFHADHANVFGNGVGGFQAGDGKLDVTGLSVGRRVLRTQTSPARPDGEPGDVLDLTPRWLLVPAALEAAALQYTSLSYVAAAPGSINPFAGALTPIVEPRLTSAVQWYLIADSAEVDTVEYAYLEGMEEPQVTSYTDEDTDGVLVKCTHSFGCKATDWRGMVRASGS